MAKMMGDPYDDFLRRDEEQAKQLDRLPICCNCGNHTQGDFRYVFPNGDIWCEDCIGDLRISNDCEV